MTTTPTEPTYANPFLQGSKVTPERIDQGVDYSGTGTLGAIARGIITAIIPPSQSGWPGYYIEYKITEPGPLQGQDVYYAEGVKPVTGLKVGQVVQPAQAIANLIPGWSTGIELGFGSGVGSSSYAAQHGGYTEGDSTVAGEQFSTLLSRLGAPAGISQSTIEPGTGPDPGIATQPFTKTSAQGRLQQQTQGGLIQTIGSDVNKTARFIGTIANFVSNPVHAVLTVALVVMGALFMYSGAGRILGFGKPVKSTAGFVGRRVRDAGAVGAAAA